MRDPQRSAPRLATMARETIEYLPRDLAHELNVAWAADTKVRIEAAIIGGGGNERGIGRAGGGLGKVRVIECVEEAGPELEPKSLAEPERSL